MKITEFLEPTAIIDDLTGSTAPEVLIEMCRPLTATTGVDSQRLAEALLAREQLASTGVGDGLAIPHGKVPGLPGLVGAFGRSRAGIDFKAPDSKPAALFFTLFAPDDGRGLHLHALARVSRVFKRAAFRESLLKAKDAAEIYELMQAEDVE
ncbi:MAG TPA: PTS sugar transporter subunit IIA [Anaeromyxobacteraceae bacterium]|nr:PTS sugar transporter subunit IIA [Anaeromyxobacteraceae bacterium]